MTEFGPFRYDADNRLLYRGDDEIMLPPRVLAVLDLLLQRPGEVVAKDDILAFAWDGAFVGEDSLTQAVSQLRQALGDDPQRPVFIQTVPRRGYRFIANVSQPVVAGRAATTRRRWNSIRLSLRNTRLLAGAIGILAIVLAIGLVIGVLLARGSFGADREGRLAGGLEFEHTLPSGFWLVHPPPAELAVSPDGTQFVYVASDGQQSWLERRRVGEIESQRIPGTEGAGRPFFSPSGRELGFFGGSDEIRRVSIAGGTPKTIARTSIMSGLTASWGEDDTLVLGGVEQRLATVSANGGPLEALTELSPGEEAHVHPHVLPGGDKVLFAVLDRDGVHLEVLDRGRRSAGIDAENENRKRLLEDVGRAWYVDAGGGYLVYPQRGDLMAVAFDVEKLEVRGGSFTIETGVAGDWAYLGASAAVGRNGAIVYVPADAALPRRRLMLAPRDGEPRPLTDRRRGWVMARFSPGDGNRLALVTEELHELGVSITEIDRFSPVAIQPQGPGPGESSNGNDTVGASPGSIRPGQIGIAIWNPANGHLTVAGGGSAGMGVYEIPVGGELLQERPLFEPPAPGIFVPVSWSPDGRFLVLNRWREGPGWDMWVFEREEGTLWRFDVDAAAGPGGSISPDGNWIVYQSGGQVLVQPFPRGGLPRPVTSDGGGWPLWSPLGDEIFFVRAGRLMSSRVQRQPELSFGEPTELLAGAYDHYHLGGINAYDAAPDAGAFVVVESDPTPGPATLVYSWRPFWERESP